MNVKMKFRVVAPVFAVLALGAVLFAAPQVNAQSEEKSAELEWLTDYDQAMAVAAEKGRPVLIDFTGSDWCGWCKKLDAEVFSTPEFKKYADSSLVLLKIDFPRNIKQDEAVRKANRSLAEKYDVKGYPTIFLTDAKGEVLGKTGYVKGGPKPYIANLESMMPQQTVKLTPAQQASGEPRWTTDLPAALKTARESGRPVLVEFVGSDWCPWCMKLEKEVFSQPAFKTYSDEELVLVKVDFPRQKKLPEAQQKANAALMEQFQVEGFPTVILLNGQGEEIARTGYQQGGADKYVAHLKQLLP